MPASYVKTLPPGNDGEETVEDGAGAGGGGGGGGGGNDDVVGESYVACHAFAATSPSHLTLAAGERVAVLTRSSDEWVSVGASDVAMLSYTFVSCLLPISPPPPPPAS